MAVKSSDLKTSSGVVSALPCKLISVNFTALAAGTPYVIVYDNATTGSGVVLCKMTNPAAVKTENFCPSEPVACSAGIYVTIANCEVVVHYAP